MQPKRASAAAIELPDPVLRPAWDGVEFDDAGAGERRPPDPPTSTFHEGRHTHSTWVYEHLTPAMVNQILDALEERRLRSLASLYPGERAKLVPALAVAAFGRRPGAPSPSDD